MKNFKIYWLIIGLVFFISCDKKQPEIPIFVQSLNADTISVLSLTIKDQDAILNFEYLTSQDSIKSIFLNYNKEKDILVSELDTFLSANEEYSFNGSEFKMYESKKIKKNSRTLFFNTDYGLLANIEFGQDYLLLKDSIKNEERNIIFKDLFLKINTITDK